MSGDLSDTTKFRSAAGTKPQPAYSAALSKGPARTAASNDPHDTPGGNGRPDGHANCVPGGKHQGF